MKAEIASSAQQLRQVACNDDVREWKPRSRVWLAAICLTMSCAAAPANARTASWPEGGAVAQRSTAATDEIAPGYADEEASLGGLRHEAADGNVAAAVQVIEQLLDRYDTSGGDDNLYEATIWIDRFHGTEDLARSGLVSRISTEHCKQRVVRYHPLCDVAE